MRGPLLHLCMLLVLAGACANNHYSYTQVSAQAGDPTAVLDFTNGISVPEGSAAGATIALISHDHKPLQGASITSANPAVLQIYPMAENLSGYVFLGVSPGTATVHVLLEGTDVQTVSAVVTSPPASSLPPMIDGGG